MLLATAFCFPMQWPVANPPPAPARMAGVVRFLNHCRPSFQVRLRRLALLCFGEPAGQLKHRTSCRVLYRSPDRRIMGPELPTPAAAATEWMNPTNNY
jgi:hypothetical protein